MLGEVVSGVCSFNYMCLYFWFCFLLCGIIQIMFHSYYSSSISGLGCDSASYFGPLSQPYPHENAVCGCVSVYKFV